MMKYAKVFVTVACAAIAIAAYAGGNPDFVKFPVGYDSSFTNYTKLNRAGSAAVGKMYANAIALSSYRNGEPAAPGSIIVMEVYKPKMDASGKPIVGSDGVNETDKLAAIAVMERRANWPAGLSESDQAGNWGFAIYNADGTPKENDLACVTCHAPLEKQDYLFSRQWLLEYAKR